MKHAARALVGVSMESTNRFVKRATLRVVTKTSTGD